jgi:hypothetical protein
MKMPELYGHIAEPGDPSRIRMFYEFQDVLWLRVRDAITFNILEEYPAMRLDIDAFPAAWEKFSKGYPHAQALRERLEAVPGTASALRPGTQIVEDPAFMLLLATSELVKRRPPESAA